MPYKVVKDGDEFCVHKKNADGSVGEKIKGACHPTKDKANRQMAALYVAESEDEGKSLVIDNEELIELLKTIGSLPLDTHDEELTTKRDVRPEVGGGVDVDKLKDSDFVLAKERAFPIVTPADVMDAVKSWGRYKGSVSFETFKSNLIKLAKRKGAKFVAALPQEWKEDMKKSYEDFIAENPSDMVVPGVGFPIKTLGGNRLGFYGYLWGDHTKKDLHGEFFTPRTDGLRELFDQLGSLPFTYHHAANGVMKAAVIGLLDVMEEDDIGMWVEVQIKNHELYRKFIKPLVDNDVLYPSGETLVGAKQVAKDGEIRRWVTSGMTGTTAPAEWRMIAYPIDELKGLLEASGHYTESQIKAVMKSLGADVNEISAADDVNDKPNVDESDMVKSVPEGAGKARLLAAFELELHRTKLAALELELL